MGDLNDLRHPDEKQGGRSRTEGSCLHFRGFIDALNMFEIKYPGRHWTWANNRENKGFVEERLDRFLASSDWIFEFPHATVHHVAKQSSDHHLLVLEAKPQVSHDKKRFYFDARLLDREETYSAIDTAWNKPQTGYPRYQVCAKIKEYRVALLKMRRSYQLNSACKIRNLKAVIEDMQLLGGFRDWRR